MSKDISLVTSGWRQLLTTIFEEIMNLEMKSRITLLFAIRDRGLTPGYLLSGDLRTYVNEIFASVCQRCHVEASLDTLFNVVICILPNYEGNAGIFADEVSSLRNEFFGVRFLANLGEQKDKSPASLFCCKAEKAWEIIKDKKHLYIPSHQELLSTMRCHELKNQIISIFPQKTDWIHLAESLKSNPVHDFGQQLSLIINKSLSEYNNKTIRYHEAVRKAVQQDLIKDILHLQCTQDAVKRMLEHRYRKAILLCKADMYNALKNQTEELAPSTVEDYIRKTKSSFDKDCKDMENEFTKYNSSEFLDRFDFDINMCVTMVSHEANIENKKAARLKADNEFDEANVEAELAATEVARGNVNIDADKAARRATELREIAIQAAASEETSRRTYREWVREMIRLGFSAFLSIFGIAASLWLSTDGPTRDVNPVIATIVRNLRS